MPVVVVTDTALGPRREPSDWEGESRRNFEAGQYAAALSAAVRAEAWDLAVEIVSARWLWFANYDWYGLVGFVRTLPDEIAARYPLIEALRDKRDVAASVTRGPDLPDPGLPDDPEGLRDLGASPGARVALVAGTRRSVFLRRAGRYQEALAVVDKLRLVAAATSAVQPEQVTDVLPVAILQWGITRQLAGDLKGAEEDFRRAWELNSLAGIGNFVSNAAGSLALTAALGGRTRLARQWAKKEDLLAEPDGWWASRIRVGGAVARTLVAVDCLEEERAAAVLDTLHDLDSWEELEAFVDYGFAQHALLWGNNSEMLSRIADHRDAYGIGLGDGIGAALLTAATVDLFLASGQGNQARAALMRNQRPHPAIVLGAARLELLTGNPKSALTEVARVLAASDCTPRLELEALLIRAAAQAELGMADPTAFRTAVDLGYHHQLLRPFLTVRRQLLADLAPLAPRGTWLLDQPALRATHEIFPDHVDIVTLTTQETAVLQLLVTDLPLRSVAEKLFVSRETIKSHQKALYQKLDVHGRPEAVARAYEWGLI
jgi:LuxR family transcriptional regulator, maltose regulon positive regulatory protein